MALGSLMASVRKQLKFFTPFFAQIMKQLSKLQFVFDVFSMFIWNMYPSPFPENELPHRYKLNSTNEADSGASENTDQVHKRSLHASNKELSVNGDAKAQ